MKIIKIILIVCIFVIFVKKNMVENLSHQIRKRSTVVGPSSEDWYFPCNVTKIDAGTYNSKTNLFYIFSGADYYWTTEDPRTGNYTPVSMGDNIWGFKQSDIDTIFTGNYAVSYNTTSNTYYFFKGAKYWGSRGDRTYWSDNFSKWKGSGTSLPTTVRASMFRNSGSKRYYWFDNNYYYGKRYNDNYIWKGKHTAWGKDIPKDLDAIIYWNDRYNENSSYYFIKGSKLYTKPYQATNVWQNSIKNKRDRDCKGKMWFPPAQPSSVTGPVNCLDYSGVTDGDWFFPPNCVKINAALYNNNNKKFYIFSDSMCYWTTEDPRTGNYDRVNFFNSNESNFVTNPESDFKQFTEDQIFDIFKGSCNAAYSVSGTNSSPLSVLYNNISQKYYFFNGAKYWGYDKNDNVNEGGDGGDGDSGNFDLSQGSGITTSMFKSSEKKYYWFSNDKEYWKTYGIDDLRENTLTTEKTLDAVINYSTPAAVLVNSIKYSIKDNIVLMQKGSSDDIRNKILINKETDISQLLKIQLHSMQINCNDIYENIMKQYESYNLDRMAIEFSNIVTDNLDKFAMASGLDNTEIKNKYITYTNQVQQKSSIDAMHTKLGNLALAISDSSAQVPSINVSSSNIIGEILSNVYNDNENIAAHQQIHDLIDNIDTEQRETYFSTLFNIPSCPDQNPTGFNWDDGEKMDSYPRKRKLAGDPGAAPDVGDLSVTTPEEDIASRRVIIREAMSVVLCGDLFNPACSSTDNSLKTLFTSITDPDEGHAFLAVLYTFTRLSAQIAELFSWGWMVTIVNGLIDLLFCGLMAFELTPGDECNTEKFIMIFIKLMQAAAVGLLNMKAKATTAGAVDMAIYIKNTTKAERLLVIGEKLVIKIPRWIKLGKFAFKQGRMMRVLKKIIQSVISYAGLLEDAEKSGKSLGTMYEAAWNNMGPMYEAAWKQAQQRAPAAAAHSVALQNESWSDVGEALDGKCIGNDSPCGTSAPDANKDKDCCGSSKCTLSGGEYTCMSKAKQINEKAGLKQCSGSYCYDCPEKFEWTPAAHNQGWDMKRACFSGKPFNNTSNVPMEWVEIGGYESCSVIPIIPPVGLGSTIIAGARIAAADAEKALGGGTCGKGKKCKTCTMTGPHFSLPPWKTKCKCDRKRPKKKGYRCPSTHPYKRCLAGVCKCFKACPYVNVGNGRFPSWKVDHNHHQCIIETDALRIS